MSNLQSATRIVELADDLRRNNLVPEVRSLLALEQTQLWDRDHRGRPYEEIAHDVWRFKRY